MTPLSVQEMATALNFRMFGAILPEITDIALNL
jgi:hypothetical protein